MSAKMSSKRLLKSLLTFKQIFTDEQFVIDPNQVVADTSEISVQTRKTVEIAVFCDDALVRSFGRGLLPGQRITLAQYVDILVTAVSTYNINRL